MSAPGSLRVLTLNVWHDAGDWPARAARIRAWLDRLEPDLIGFQEILLGPGVDLLADLVGERGYETAWVEASRFWRDAELGFGNAVATRWPIEKRETLALPDGGDGETRAALAVQVAAPVGPLLFSCTHLNWKFHHGHVRERQVHALARWLLAQRPKPGFPPILVGDLNAEPDSDEIRYLTGLSSVEGSSVYFHDAWRVAGGGGDGITWSNRNPHARANLEPERRIDYVLTGYPQPDGVGLLERCRVVCDDAVDGVWPSDHFGVLAELRMQPLPGPIGLR